MSTSDVDKSHTDFYKQSVNDLLEALNNSSTEPECLCRAYDAVNLAINDLISKIFHKDDHAVKYVVDPLLSTDGPLSDIITRCRLLLGLGVIDKVLYDDIEILITLNRWADLAIETVIFDDPNVLFELNRISLIKNTMPIESLSEFMSSYSDEINDDIKAIYSKRYFLKIRSTLYLSVTQLIDELLKDSPLT